MAAITFTICERRDSSDRATKQQTVFPPQSAESCICNMHFKELTIGQTIQLCLASSNDPTFLPPKRTRKKDFGS